jgi:peptidoglycan/LPS O-acetylase OafA/YrhL
MGNHLPLTRLLASALLGILAAVAVVFAVLMLFAAWTIGSDGPGLGNAGVAWMLTLAVLVVAYGLLAAWAARDEWLGWDRGRLLGLIAAGVAVLVAVVALFSADLRGQEPLLYILAGLGLVTMVPLILPEKSVAA